MRVLIIEDQKKTASFLEKGLTAAGYAVDCAETILNARDKLAAANFDALIVDVNLPDESGLSFVREVRVQKFVGVILLLTALSATEFKIQGLDAGADDYMTKPFSIEELLARLRAQLRKTTNQEQWIALRYADLELDLVKRRLTRSGHNIELSAKEFALIEYFLRNPERPLSRALISEHVWNLDYDSESNLIDVYVNHLRRKLDVAQLPRLIQTVTGIGYVLSEERA